MMRQRKTRLKLVLLLLSLVFLLFVYTQTSNRNLNIQTNPDKRVCTSVEKPTLVQVRNMSEELQSPTIKPAKVIIVAHGRSGSSFLGGIFNAHPDIFFLFEPLNQMKRIVKRSSKEYQHKAEHVVKSILNCNIASYAFLEVLSRHTVYRASSRPLVSPPFCKTGHEKASNFLTNSSINWKLCYKERISADKLNKMCRKQTNIVTKILLEQLEPADLTWLVDINRPFPVYVLYLVRDPRAMLYSRYKLGWVVPRKKFKQSLANGKVDEKVKKVCEVMELNLGAVLLQPERIKLIRYEELATNPEAMARRLFSELHISQSADVFRWIHSKTHGSHGPVKISSMSLSRNANVSINSWRGKISHQFLEIIEKRCERVMKYLGYLSTQDFQRGRGILRDLSTPLYLEKIRDLKETYQWPVV